MKRTAVLRKIKVAARQAGVQYGTVELTHHTGVIGFGAVYVGPAR